MRIAIIGDALDFQYAGVKVYLEGLLKALSLHSNEHDFILIRAIEKKQFEGIKEIIVPVKSWFPMHRRFRYFFEIPKVLHALEVDAVIEPAHFGPFWLASSIKRINIVHDLTPIIFPQFHPKFSQFYHQYIFPKTLANADLIISNSNNTKKDIVTYFPFTKNKIHTIYPGLPSNFASTFDTSFLKKYQIQSPYILSVSTIEPRKNLSLLLKAFAHLKKQKRLKHQLVLVGKKGWGNKAFDQLIEDLDLKNAIVFTGFVPALELPSLYALAAAFVYPSFYEGFGLPVLEAMACGAPVLISNTSSLPEVGGEAAIYFNPSKEEELIQQLEKLLTNEEESANRRELSFEQRLKFSWEKSIAQLLPILEKLK